MTLVTRGETDLVPCFAIPAQENGRNPPTDGE
ncbi:hypothetical protein C5167_004518 [Papaver somniferum]|uniref:Uncharacterized protein n=1 Tax=Papaver somniferum TaxID=3469 RepID=A0A4Y7JC49_PAPSO|nr:hypothetical protein C5167_004518 [Papaver somniferum]